MAALRTVLIVWVCFAAAPALGAEVYRCVSAAGAVSFQDAPCAAGSQLSRTIPVLVDPAKPDDENRRVSKRTATAGKPGAGQAKSKARSDARGKQRAACEKARKQRDAALDRLGLHRTFEKLQALDANVQEACKGL